MLRVRHHKESNYHSIYVDGKTMRMPIEDNKPILSLDFPEFYDIKLTSKCIPGNCDFCYMNSDQNGFHAENAVEKIHDFFGCLPMTHRPFQVAMGGGEPTLHPEFIQILEEFDKLNITPNYTTNGVNVSEEILDATKQFCGGVAISAHKHLKEMWLPTMRRFLDKGIFMSLHHIVYDEQSVDDFLKEMRYWGDEVKYHVLLPLIPQGRAKNKLSCSDYLFKKLKKMKMDKLQKVAFGALLYEELKKHKLPVFLYDPEAFSRFMDLSNMKCYKSSFDLTESPVPIHKFKEN